MFDAERNKNIKTPKNNKYKIAPTLLFFAIIVSAAIVYFVIAGEIRIVTDTDIITNDVISYAHSPIKFISILVGLGFVVVGLFVARWLELQHKD